jgi:uncharacterized membrane protein YsdA (DUF1294 family)
MGANSLTSNNASGSKMRVRTERLDKDSRMKLLWRMPETGLWAFGKSYGVTGSISRELPFNQIIEKLKAKYKFYQVNEISTLLKSYSFLISDLNKIYEIMSRYFDASPMDLYYMSETGSLESATLTAYIKASIPRERVEDIFSRFDEEWWDNISKEAKTIIMVDMVRNV